MAGVKQVNTTTKLLSPHSKTFPGDGFGWSQQVQPQAQHGREGKGGLWLECLLVNTSKGPQISHYFTGAAAAKVFFALTSAVI